MTVTVIVTEVSVVDDGILTPKLKYVGPVERPSGTVYDMSPMIDPVLVDGVMIVPGGRRFRFSSPTITI